MYYVSCIIKDIKYKLKLIFFSINGDNLVINIS